MSANAADNRPVVISIHGINTRGAWQKEDLTKALGNAGFTHIPIDFGGWRTLWLLLPFFRRSQIHWFRDKYTRHHNNVERPPSIIAHSFGTYLVARSMQLYSEIVFDRIILCGSIVARDYPWPEMLAQGRCNSILHEYGKKDWPVRFAERFISDAGESGAVGFSRTEDNRLIQRLHSEFGHSDYFYELNYTKNWVPYLGGSQPGPVTKTPAQKANWKFRIYASLLLVALIAGLVFCSVKFGWFSGPKVDPVKFLDFAAQYEASGYKGAQFEAFKNQYADKRVTWDATIRELYPDSKLPAYWIEPLGGTPQRIERFHAVFDPSKYNPALVTGAKVRISGEITHIGPSQVLLQHCEFIP